MKRLSTVTAVFSLVLLFSFVTHAQSETVSVHGAGTIAYKTYGAGDRTLILIHGYSFSKEVWDKAAPLIDDDWTVYAFDIRGFGDSDKPEEGYDYPSMVNDLAAFMDALSIDRAVIGGHSLGGTFIQDFAVRYPNRVDGLILANAQARNLPPMGMSESFLKRIDAWGDPETNRAIFEKATPRYFKDPLPAAELTTLIAMNEKSATPALKQAFSHLLTADPIDATSWPALDMPILIVASTHDLVPFKVPVALLDALPTASLSVIARSGHTPMWEKPNEFAESVNDFLDDL